MILISTFYAQVFEAMTKSNPQYAYVDTIILQHTCVIDSLLKSTDTIIRIYRDQAKTGWIKTNIHISEVISYQWWLLIDLRFK